jgi:transcription initiation factor TFIIB
MIKDYPQFFKETGMHMEILSKTKQGLRCTDFAGMIKEVNLMKRARGIAMVELERMATALHLPQNIKEQAALLYIKALKMVLIRGRSIDAFVAATLYAGCRQNNLPRPLKEISKLSTREHGEIARTRLVLSIMINEFRKILQMLLGQLK